MTTTNIETAQSLIEVCFSKKVPVFLWGSPGIGKSDLIRSIATKHERPVIDMRLILMEPTDLKGIPYYCPKTDTMRWSISEDLPTMFNGLESAILFLDEMNSAPQSVQGAAYQLVLDRKIGSYKLPDEVDIIAAGNHTTDRGVTYAMPKPLANRFYHINMEANTDSWIKWAIKNKVNKNIVSFISARKDYLFDFNPKSNEQAFATPRSWHVASRLIQGITNQDMILNLISGSVGQAKAVEYLAFFEVESKLPSIEDVISGKVKSLEKDLPIDGHHFLCMNFIYHINEHKADAGGDFNILFDFIMNNMSAEMSILFVKMILTGGNYNPIASKSEGMTKFKKKYGKYL